MLLKFVIRSLTLLLIFCSSCNSINKEKRFTLMPESHTQVSFKNIIKETEEFNVLEYGYLYNGGGVAAGDLNNDGLVDLYFTGNMMGSHLYINQGDLVFEEIAKEAGVFASGLWNTGVTMADVNADGYLDIYVCRSAASDPTKRENLLFINNKDLTFTEMGKAFGIADNGYSTHASFFDYDNDGDLDLYVLNHSTQEFAGFSQITSKLKQTVNKYYADKLYRNDNGVYKDVSEEAGIISNVLGFGLGLAVSDINNDGWLDIYISNDYNEQDYLYINQKNGTFKEQLSDFVGHTSLFSMGSDIADLNNDGFMDIITLDMLPEDNYRQKMVSGPDNYEKFTKLAKSGFHHQTMRNMLQINNKGLSFSEIGQFSGISNTDWSWAPLIADFDNDGYKDIYITNGYKRDFTNMDFMNYAVQQKMKENKTGVKASLMSLLDKMPATVLPNYMYHNQGNIRFSNVGKSWGITQNSLSNGAAYADLDNDGDLDIIVNNLDETSFIYRNNTDNQSKSKYLKIQFKGPKENTMGIGARVTLHTNNTTQTQEFIPSRGYQSSMVIPLHFGFSEKDSIEKMEVFWPDGQHQAITDLKENTLHTVFYEDAIAIDTSHTKEDTFFSEKNRAENLIDFYHKKNAHNDFKSERLLPHKLSTQGPRMVKADVNNDRLEDVFIPGGKGTACSLFIQNKDGSFKETNTNIFSNTKLKEVVNAHFFDADGDGDMDIYLVMGGNEFPLGSQMYQDELYLNDGNGKFTYFVDALPNMKSSGLAIASGDVDNDGDLDLFIGGRVVTNSYPEPPASYILQNNGDGTFIDATKQLAPDLENLGMITDAVLEDVNANGLLDLILVGEWMPITLFENKNNQLKPLLKNTGLEDTEGWWNTIYPIDFDNDGDIDFVVGNLGLNSQLKASVQEPVCLYYADFDDNGSLDPILTSYIQGKEYPVYSKDDMQDQLLFIKKKYVNYSDYADQQIQDILTKEQLQKAQKLCVKTFAHLILENIGDNNFVTKALPKEAQWSPIFGVSDLDINDDGNVDLILTGNFYGSRIKFGRYDANKGQLFLGDGKANWQFVPNNLSGFNISGEIRDIEQIQDSHGNNLLLFSQTEGPLQIYESNTKELSDDL